jgi:hypothetical protein
MMTTHDGDDFDDAVFVSHLMSVAGMALTLHPLTMMISMTPRLI